MKLQIYKTFGYEGKRWVCYLYAQRWDFISFGFHICLSGPNIEIHLPFSFIRIGRLNKPERLRL